MKLPPQLDKLSRVKHAKAIGLLLAILLGVLILFIATLLDPKLGYYLLLTSLVPTVFFLPYIFGWRDAKMLVAMGISVFLLLGAINGPLVVHSTYSAQPPEPVSSSVHVDWFTKTYTKIDGSNYTTPSSWYRLEGGTLETYKGEMGQEYIFSITYYSNDTAQPDIRLGYAKGIWGVEGSPTLTEVDPADTNCIDGKEYICTLVIDSPGIYSHWFAVVFGTGTDTNSLNTTVALGPLVGTQSDNWGIYIPIGALSMFCNIGLLFVIVVLLYWWLGTAKAKRREWDDALREKEGSAEAEHDGEAKPFSCDQCGAPVGAEDNFCPKCGDRFDGVDDDAREDGGDSKADGKAEEEDS